MKKLMRIAFLFVAALTLSCSSDSDNESQADGMYINFTANGTNYEFEDPATLTSLSATIEAHRGLDNTYTNIMLVMPTAPTVGVHQLQLDDLSLNIYSASFGLGDVYVESATGTINITSISGEYIKGTFSFTGTYEGTTYNITNGTFRAYKPEE